MAYQHVLAAVDTTEEAEQVIAEAQQIATDEHNDHTAQYLVGTPLLAECSRVPR